MQRFAGAVTRRWLVAIVVLIMIGMGALCAISPFIDPTVAAWQIALLVPFGVLIASGGLAFLRFEGFEAWARYSADDRGIEKESWFGRQRIDWDAVAAYSVTGARRPTYRLSGGAITLKVPLSYLGSDAGPFASLLDERLAPVNARMLNDLRVSGRTFHPDRGALCPVLCMMAVIFAGLAPVGLLVPPKPGDPPWIGYAVAAGCAALAAVFAAAAYSAYTRVLKVDGRLIEDFTLWRNRRIPLGELETIERKRVSSNGQVTEVYRLRCPGQCISFASSMPSHGLIVQLIRSAAPQAEFVDHGAPPSDPTKQREWAAGLSRKRTLYFALTSLIGLGSMGLGGVILARERRYEIGGVNASGSVTRIVGRRVYYRYLVLGETYEGRSRVVDRAIGSLRVGGPIEVEYLSSNPSVSRALLSRGRGTGLAIMPIACGALLVLLAAYSLVRPPARIREIKQLAEGNG